MRVLPVALLLVLAGPGQAQVQVQVQVQDSAGWIRQCLSDTAGQSATPQVRSINCICMVGQANDTETSTVAALERINPGAAQQCRAMSGWP